MNLYICLHVGYLQEMNVVVVCATCLLDIYYGKEGLHIWVCQIEIDLHHGFVKPRLRPRPGDLTVENDN